MCGGGYPFTPYGMAPPSQWGMGPSFYDQQMMGMQNIAGWQQSSRYVGTPQLPKPKKCVCSYCGRPANAAQESSCPGCGAWEVESK